MDRDKISIIVPIYNVDKYLVPCINSIIAQSYKNLEIILIDDGSTDKSAKICQAYAIKNKRITVLSQKNQGLSAARNAGLKIATGDFITFIDGDDWVHQDFINLLYAAIDKNRPSISLCGYREVGGKKPHNETPSKDQIIPAQIALQHLLLGQKNLDVIVCNKLYHCDLFKTTKFPVGKIHEDNLTTYKLYSAASTVACIKQPLYFYRRRPDSITAKNAGEKADHKETAALEAIEWLGHHNKRAVPAAEISLLYAKLTHLDLMIESGKIDAKKWQATVTWIKYYRTHLAKNPHMSPKLKLYLNLLVLGDQPYKILKKLLLIRQKL